jgi:hypothetical protein
MFSIVLQPNLSHRVTGSQPRLLSLSLIKTCCQQYPSATPQKIPIFITVSQKNIIFHRVMWAFLGFFVSVRVSQRKQGKQEPSYLFPSLSLFSYLSFLFLSLYSVSLASSLSLFLTHLSFFFIIHLSVPLFLSL